MVGERLNVFLGKLGELGVGKQIFGVGDFGVDFFDLGFELVCDVGLAHRNIIHTCACGVVNRAGEASCLGKIEWRQLFGLWRLPSSFL